MSSISGPWSQRWEDIERATLVRVKELALRLETNVTGLFSPEPPGGEVFARTRQETWENRLWRRGELGPLKRSHHWLRYRICGRLAEFYEQTGEFVRGAMDNIWQPAVPTSLLSGGCPCNLYSSWGALVAGVTLGLLSMHFVAAVCAASLLLVQA